MNADAFIYKTCTVCFAANLETEITVSGQV